MPPRKRSVTPSVFDAVRRDTSLTAANEIAVAVRPEWVWAAQILTRLSQESSTAAFGQRYLSVIANITPRHAVSESADRTSRLFGELLDLLWKRRARAVATRIAQTVAQLIDEADASACISVSDGLGSAALMLCAEARPTASAQLMWRVARARRKMGDLGTAETYYASVLAIGRRQKDDALIARGAMGLAILARERGNIESLIRLFDEAHEHAQRSKSRELQILAHQGMQIAAGVIGDRAAELRHVWLAYSLSIGDAVHEYEALHNVAWYACQAGIANEALPALQAVLAQVQLTPRLKLHYLGTTATAAAQCHRRDIVDEVRRELDRYGDTDADPREKGFALTYVCEALKALGDKTLWRQYRGQAHAIAKRFGLNELLQRLSSPQAPAGITYPVDSETAAEVEEVRRVLRTITGGVLESACASRQAVHMAHSNELT